jgi:hypothetical protein
MQSLKSKENLKFTIVIMLKVKKKGKAVLLHAMKVPGGRGGEASTHFQPQH